MRFLIILIGSLFCAALHAQAPDTVWTKTYELGGLFDEGRSVQQTSDGGYIIAGYTDGLIGDLLLIRTDSDGDTMWTKIYGGSDNDQGYSVQETSDGGFIITGHTASFGIGFVNLWLIKTDDMGDTLWTRTYGGFSYGYGKSVMQIPGGGYVITGQMNSGACLLNTNANGDIVWLKIFGGGGDNQGNSVQQTSDGGYIIAGYTNSFGAGGNDVLLIKTNAVGDTSWTRTYGTIDEDIAYCVRQTSDGDYVIVGEVGRPLGFGFSDIWLLKTDANGDTLWAKKFGEASNDDRAYGMDITSDGSYIITGYIDNYSGGSSGLRLIKTNSDGDILWTKTIGETSCDQGYSVQQTSDDGYIISGRSDPDCLDSDVWLIKLAPDVTSIDENPQYVIGGYYLWQNYPNPFNPSTRIDYRLPKSARVKLKIYNVLGQEVQTLVNEGQMSGNKSVLWDGRDQNGRLASSGVYIYRIEAGDYAQTRKMVLIR